MTNQSWESFIDDAVESGRRGVSCLNQQVLDSINDDEVGFYIYTDKTNFARQQYKCGQSIRGLKRIGEQAQQSERLYVVDWIPSELAHTPRKDQQIHEELHESNKSEWLYRLDKESSPGKEWSVFPDNNPAELWNDYLAGNITRAELTLTCWQKYALERIITSFSEGKRKIMAELAARFGKTTTYLSLFDVVQTKVMVVGSYVLTVEASFKKEINRFTQFAGMEFLNLSDDDFETKFNALVKSDKQIVIFASLCGSDKAEKNAEIINRFNDKFVIVDEADYGAHTKSKVPFVNMLTGDSPCILTTGTNSDRARGSHSDIDDFFKVSYFDMLMMRDS
jgi:hypothetical protein